MKDFITQYKEQHGLNDDWEKETRDKINNIKESKTDTKKSRDDFHGDCDSIYTIENGTATILYIVVMFVAIIFNDRILIWIVASFIYFRFIARHKK